MTSGMLRTSWRNHAARGQGPVRVRLQLRQKGLEGPLVDERLASYPGLDAAPARGAKEEIWRRAAFQLP